MTNSENISTVSESIDVSENLDFDIPLTDQSSLAEPLRKRIERHPQVGFDPEQLVPAQTYVECGIEKLTALAAAVGLSGKTEQITEIFRALTTSWGDKAVGDVSTWQSDVSDDHAPFEFSLALDPDKVELRVLVEAQGTDANLQSNWQAGLDLNQYLAANYHVSLDRFEQIADLYAPTNPEAKFSIWHAVCFYPDKEPAFKLYLNPQSQSQSRSAAIVEESLVRLGFTHAWPTLAETAAQRGPDKDEFACFSLDLASHDRARVKVYLRHHDATPAELESALSAARNYVPGDAIEFCNAMAEGQASFSEKPAITCFSLIEGDDITPSGGTLSLPVSNYTPDDLVMRDRLDRYLVEHDLPVFTYNSAIQSLATRPLGQGVGMHSYTSFRREQQQRRITVYLNPEVHSIQYRSTTTKLKPAKALPSLEALIWYYEEHELTYHPFFQRLQREPVNPQYLWLLIMNIRETATNFTRRLATVIAKIEDDRIRCILAKQLNDELGNGDINRIHRNLFTSLMTTIEPWEIDSPTENMLSPGKKVSDRVEEIYLDSNPYLGLGAMIVSEIYAKQFDICLGNELRRTSVDSSKIKWVTIHEELEVEHANESLILASFVADSAENIAAARQGIEKTCLASWVFLNELYQLCYGK
jgi:DMATS type aromatic prenyltransferase